MFLNRPSAKQRKTSARAGAPSLWVEGSQRPRFDIRAFVRVSLLLSRAAARPVLLNGSSLLVHAAEQMVENTLGPRLSRASRLGRALPSREGVAQAIVATAVLIAKAADLAASPPAAEPEPTPAPVRPPLLVNRRSYPSALPMPPAEPDTPGLKATVATSRDVDYDFDAPTLAAIRALIDDMRDPPKVAPKRRVPAALPPPSGLVLLSHAVPLSPPERLPRTIPETLADHAFNLASAMLAAVVTLCVMPVGLVKAALAHLNGQDLRSWP